MLSEQQLIGRVWRYPQPKTVHIYRLIGAKSPDIFLNNISFSKGFIQDTFSNIGNKLSECNISKSRWVRTDRAKCEEIALQIGEEDDRDPALSADSSESEDTSLRKPSRSKSKGKAKQAKPKEKAVPQPPGKGKGKKSQTEEATGSTPVGQDTFPLPQLVAELEALLPQFDAAAQHIMDEMDPDFDDAMAQFKLADRPNMQEYVEMQITMAETQMTALERTSMLYPGAISTLGQRLTALKGWKDLYQTATLSASGSLQATHPLHLPEVHVGEAGTGLPGVDVSRLFLDGELLLT